MNRNNKPGFVNRIMFICYGNICRSPMAECVLAHKVSALGMKDSFVISSSATSTCEEGSPIYRKSQEKLKEKKISVLPHRSTALKPSDYDVYDMFLCMDRANLRDAERIFGGDPDGKLSLLLSHAGGVDMEIEDPWYSRDFEKTYIEIAAACDGLLKELTQD